MAAWSHQMQSTTRAVAPSSALVARGPARGSLVVLAAKKSMACTTEGTNRCGLSISSWLKCAAVASCLDTKYLAPQQRVIIGCAAHPVALLGWHRQGGAGSCGSMQSSSCSWLVLISSVCRKRRTTSGFRSRMQSATGQKVLKARRKKGRHVICPASQKKVRILADSCLPCF
jgi:large subunit ribosomal protein L34